MGSFVELKESKEYSKIKKRNESLRTSFTDNTLWNMAEAYWRKNDELKGNKEMKEPERQKELKEFEKKLVGLVCCNQVALYKEVEKMDFPEKKKALKEIAVTIADGRSKLKTTFNEKPLEPPAFFDASDMVFLFYGGILEGGKIAYTALKPMTKELIKTIAGAAAKKATREVSGMDLRLIAREFTKTIEAKAAAKGGAIGLSQIDSSVGRILTRFPKGVDVQAAVGNPLAKSAAHESIEAAHEYILRSLSENKGEGFYRMFTTKAKDFAGDLAKTIEAEFKNGKISRETINPTIVAREISSTVSLISRISAAAADDVEMIIKTL